jgi:Ca2+-binding RTX toxin-like protein
LATYSGTNGDDSYWGGPDSDHIEGLGGRDHLNGNGGDDEIFGGDGDDNLHGQDGNDLLEGGDGDDLLAGEGGLDILRGQAGDDRMLLNTYNSSTVAGASVDGGEGVDTLQFDGFSLSTPITFSIADPAITQNLYGAMVVNVERLAFRSGGGNDDITGGALDDSIDGYDGNDRIDGGLGNDGLDGGFGTDTIYGGGGDDSIYGGSGGIGDMLYGGDGDDTLRWNSDALIDGGAGSDQLRIEYQSPTGTTADLSDPDVEVTVLGTRVTGIERLYFYAGSGNDVLTGGVGDDQLAGNGGDDILAGGTGNDTLSGGDGNDQLSGGAGDDYLHNVTGDSNPADLFDGGDGFDVLEFRASSATGPITIDLLDTTGMVTNVEQIFFSGGFSAGGSGVYNVSGGAALDIMQGGSGGDRFEGRGGNDDLRGGGGNDVLLGGDGDDLLIGDQGSDQLYGGDGNDLIHGGSEGSYLEGGAGNDGLYGAGGADILIGGDGDDWLIGGGGDDVMTGGVGNDFYVVDSAGDSINENAGEGIDEIQTGLATYSLLGTAVENLTATTNVNHDFRGSAADNVLSGRTGNDFFRLQDGGDDWAVGGNGNDVFLFGGALTGADRIIGGVGTDQIAIQGDYAGANALTLGVGVFSFESIAILPGSDTRFGDPGTNFYDYNLTTLDSNVAAGVQVIVDANRLRLGEDFTFDGSAESDGGFFVWGGGGTDTLTGGSMTDIFYFGENGQFGASDVVNGGAGIDQLGLRGNYTIVFGAGQLTGIESIGLVSAQDTRFGALGSTYNYNLTLNDANLASGVLMTVDGAALRGGETLTFNGSAETDGLFRIFGGQGNDVITTGAGNDILQGGRGADDMTGGAGADSFRYLATADSPMGPSDRIFGFEGGIDKIDLSRIDADVNTPGDQAFSFIGGASFSNHAGELRAVDLANNMWAVMADTDGNGQADLWITVTRTDSSPMIASDFIP